MTTYKLKTALAVAALDGAAVRVYKGTNAWPGRVTKIDLNDPRVEVRHARTGKIHRVHWSIVEAVPA